MNHPVLTTSGTSSFQTGFECGACKHGNVATAQFCAGCGQALFEPCGKCTQPVRLEQKFCGGCGTDLQLKRENQRQQFEKWLVDSIEATKISDFERAIGLLQRVASNTDYRYAEISQQAAAAIPKVEKLQAQRLQAVADLVTRSEAALSAGDKASVVEMLSRVPEAMRTPEIRQMLDGCSTFVGQVQSLEQVLQEKLADKDYEGLAGTIEELLELLPNNETYTKLARKIADKLMSSSQRRFDRQDYEGAAAQLGSVPAQMRDERYEAARQTIEKVEWLEKQFVAEPFATSTLGRLAVRFEKESPQNERAKQNTKELLHRTKQPSANSRVPFNPWRGDRQCWMGGEVGYLGYPLTIDCGSDANIRRQPGRFTIAMGLALQGLGLGLVGEGFPVAKKSRFAMLGAKKPKTCWGIDIGSAGIRAVLLQLEKDEVTLLQSYSEDFETPLSRVGNEGHATTTISGAVTKFLESIESSDAPYWVNMPAGDIVSRFVRLPPVKNKKADELLKFEARQRIPMPADILEFVDWMGALDENSTLGRPAFVCAAKKAAVASRTELLASAGLKIAGMQADQVALVNFVSREFSSVLADAEADALGKFHSIALVDAGATFTTLVLVSKESFWYWSIESGGEDLTSALARSLKLTHSEAEELKRFPAKIDNPRDGYEAVEQRLGELRSRLQKVLAEGENQNGRTNIGETWCVGGSPLTHAWIRIVLLAD